MKKREIIWICLGLMLLSTISGCGGDDVSAPVLTPMVNVTGYWDTTEVVDNSACGRSDDVGADTYLFVQDGDFLNIQTASNIFGGMVIGSALTWQGQFAEAGGVTTIDQLHMNVDATNSSFSGKIDWSWSDGLNSCTGSTAMTGTRLTPAATQIYPGDVISAAAPAQGNSDYYYMLTETSIPLTFTLNADSSVSDLDLYFWDGFSLGPIASSTSSTYPETFSGISDPNDFFYIEVNTFTLPQPANYELRVTSP